MRVAPLLEVALKGARPPVRVVAADLALVLDVEPVQLVQPVRDRLAWFGLGLGLGVGFGFRFGLSSG